MSQAFWNSIEAFYKLLNLGGDGKLREYEVRTMLPVALRAAFRHDSDLAQDSYELSDLSNKHAERLFQELDTDQDGVISLEEFKKSYRDMLLKHVEEELIYIDVSRSITALVEFHTKNNAIRDKVLSNIMSTLWPALLKESPAAMEEVSNTLDPVDSLTSSIQTTSLDALEDASIAPSHLPAIPSFCPENMDTYKVFSQDVSGSVDLDSPVMTQVLDICWRSMYAIPEFHNFEKDEFVKAILQRFNDIMATKSPLSTPLNVKTVTAHQFLELFHSVFTSLPTNHKMLDDMALALEFLKTKKPPVVSKPRNMEEVWKSQHHMYQQQLHKESLYPEFSRQRYGGQTNLGGMGFDADMDDFGMMGGGRSHRRENPFSSFNSRLGANTMDAIERDDPTLPPRPLTSSFSTSSSRASSSSSSSSSAPHPSSRATKGRLPPIDNGGEDF